MCPGPDESSDGKHAEPDLRPCHVVGIGASAGGLDALERFFENVPQDCGMAFVLVQHLSPDFKSLMDEIDGFEFARRVRENSENAGLFLVALTGYGRAVDREQAVAAGFDAHLVKPVDTRMLLSLLAPDSSDGDDARVSREPRMEVEVE